MAFLDAKPQKNNIQVLKNFKFLQEGQPERVLYARKKLHF